mmetsp:Transcript_8177/g.12210  ORF Transcript_8177/g.12210 Transcript_8177/m.12210 type:complete len:378 (+) Transcript_8177:78-1211(+)
MELFHEGNLQFIDENYDSSIEIYSKALVELPNFVPLILNRGTAYLKLKKLYEALDDFNLCLSINPNLERAHFRKGVAYFESEEFESAKSSFQKAIELKCQNEKDPNLSIFYRYIRKCDAEIKEEENVITANKKESPVVDKPKSPQPSAAVNSQSLPKPAALPPLKYQYYQSNSSLTIDILAKNLTVSDVVVDIQPHHLTVTVQRTPTTSEVVINKELFAEVNVESSKMAIFKSKVEVVLVKIEQEVWPTLDHNGAPRLPKAPAVVAAAEADPIQAKRPKPYASARDWDAVGSVISKELEADKPQGEEALNALFQQIYKDADQETKMAMKKSFQTSGGTVLSTNWKEVKEKNYEEERQAPKGMEWRSWEGEKLKQIED